MKPTSILLSGATGFLGSHLAEELSLNDFKVIALVRSTSDLSRCNEFKNDNLVFVNTDLENHKDLIQKHQPTVFIHSAWSGVSAKGRNDWDIQVENIAMTTRFLVLAEELNIKKIISFGSQAEYGNFNGRIKEDAICNPVTAYGAAKLGALQVLKSFCELHSVNWFWFRIFSVYGTRENSEWLIPSVIQNTFQNKPMNLTGCEQRYDYICANDICKAIMKVLITESESGIFNLSSNSSMRLKEMIEKIRDIVNPHAVLNFGALPYRTDQVMHMEGDSSRFNERFSFHVGSKFEKNIEQIFNYLKNKNYFLSNT